VADGTNGFSAAVTWEVADQDGSSQGKNEGRMRAGHEIREVQAKKRQRVAQTKKGATVAAPCQVLQ